MAISFTFHMVGVVFWLGGIIFLTRIMKLLDQDRIADDGLVRLVRVSWNGFVLPGAALLVASGLYQLLYTGLGHFMKQGWFHGKLTLVLILVVLTVIVALEVGKVGRKVPPSRMKLSVCHGGVSAILVLVIALTYFGRGY